MRYFSPAIPRSSPAAVCTSAGSEALAALTGHTPDIGQGTPETGQISGGEACGLQGTAGGDGGDGGEAVFAAPGAVGTASAGVGAPLCSAATATAASSLKLPNVALFVKPSMLVWITVSIAVLGSEPIARACDRHCHGATPYAKFWSRALLYDDRPSQCDSRVGVHM
jgi:hypothetical protein